jgi:uncharacterized protein
MPWFQRKTLLVQINLTNACNLACSYCYKKNKDRLARTPLSIEQLMAFSDWVLAARRPQTFFQFHGGEPTLRWKTLVEHVESTKRLLGSDDTRVAFGMTSNGVMYDQAKIDWTIGAGLNPCISFDGPAGVQNKNRPKKKGEPSYDDVSRNVTSLLRVRPDTLAQATVVDPEQMNASLDEFLRLGFRRVSFRPAYFPHTIRDQRFAQRLAECHLDLARRIFRLNLIQPTIIDEAIAGLLRNLFIQDVSQRFMCNNWPCGAGWQNLCLDANGDLYPCDEFTGDSRWCLGNISSAAREPLDAFLRRSLVVRTLQSRSGPLNERCAACPVKAACGGGCVANTWRYQGSTTAPDPMCHYYRTLVGGLKQLVAEEPVAIALLVDPWVSPEQKKEVSRD